MSAQTSLWSEWRRPVSREYWRLLIDDELAIECYCNRANAEWFVERVYD